jgi:tetratricopeptide (TPR) repeat protein
MHSYSRSLALSSALLIAAIICVMSVGAQAPKPAAAPAPAPRATAETESGPPPISFSDPDGQELILEDLSARAAIHGMLSLTELEFRFRNPKNTRIEGRFTCTLPANAAISRFAKSVNGQLMEGEVIERLRANQVYESYLHQMRDPALLEQDQGNRFSARIFPIEANDTVRILLSYTTLLPLRDGVRTYTLPLRGISQIRDFSFRGFVTPLPGEESVGAAQSGASYGGWRFARSSADVLSVEERDFTPVSDIELSWRPSANATAMRVLRAGDFYLAAWQPRLTASPGATPNAWTFYIDTSASAAEGAAHRIRALETILGALPPGDDVQLLAFDNDVVSLGSGSAAQMSGSIRRLLTERLFLGGTDLAGAMLHAANAVRTRPRRAYVFVSDFAATLGATSSADVLAAARAIPANALVHALILGSRQDAPSVKALTAGRGRALVVPFSETLAERAREAADALRQPPGATISASDASAEWMYPNRFDDVQPGDEIIALGKVRAGGEPAVSFAGGPQSAQTSSLAADTFAPLLEREAYRAYLEYLAEREASEPSEAIRRALATEQVRISVEQRVVIPRTTMLVLENEWEYQRFNIDRRALAAILTIEAGGISRIDRRGQVPPVVTQATRPTLKDQVRPEGAILRGTIGGTPPPSAPSDMAQPERGDMREERRAMAEAQAPMAADAVVGGAVSEAITVTANAAAVAAAPAPPPPPPAPAVTGRIGNPVGRRRIGPEKRSDGAWAQPGAVSKEEIADLRTRLRDTPRDRELYNQLSERLVRLQDWSSLRALVLDWQPLDPENPQVYELLGYAAEGLNRNDEAARAFASLIEVAPAKTELLQRAGLLLVRVGRASLAETPLRRALEIRPDRANAYRHLALMLWLDQRPAEAARVLESGLRQTFPGWYGNVHRVMREELAYVYRSWGAMDSDARRDIEDRARELNVDLNHRDDVRFTLAWETDANDVDLHVVDPSGEECFYGNRENESGLMLYEDITQGLGPEVIRAEHAQRGTYQVGVRYFAAGPMGVSRGLVVVVRDDKVSVHPFRLVQGGGDIRYVTAVTVK